MGRATFALATEVRLSSAVRPEDLPDAGGLTVKVRARMPGRSAGRLLLEVMNPRPPGR